MPYLTFADRSGEFDRRELTDEPLVIGRALDCDVCVRDILLSRRHCRIEPFDGRWVVTDLGSKNGTRISNEMITRHILSDGEVVMIGKIQVGFHAGAFVPRQQPPQRRDVRPADPNEALSGTVLGFQLFDMEEDSRVSGFPIPRPRPAEPATYRQEAANSIVAQMTSSAWDLALAEDEILDKPANGKTPVEVIERQRDIEQVRKSAKADPQPAAAVAAPASVVEEEETRPAPLRRLSPTQRATIPKWLAHVYITLAAAIGAASLCIIVLKSGLHVSWLAQ